MITLVIGLRGTGKTTYCQNHLGEDGLCYDLDAIASAFRLRMPHEEYHSPSRMMANDLLFGFITHAWQYSDNVFVIRTAPKVKELREINPDRVVVCRKRYILREMDDETAANARIGEVIRYCKANGIEITDG